MWEKEEAEHRRNKGEMWEKEARKGGEKTNDRRVPHAR
jgi:hypothetical protein